jgi:23S rRNA (guanosine2251-2'-O)-methyltransferase
MSRKRPSQKQYYIYGIHPSFAALQNPNRRVVEVLVTASVFEQHNGIIEKYRYRVVTSGMLTSILKADVTHQGLAVLVNQVVESDIRSIDFEGPNTKIAILDQITDVHNIGAIMRSAAAFGIKAIVMTYDNSPEENGAMAKAACGALEIVPIIRVTNLKSTLDLLKKAGFWIAGLDGASKESISQANLSGKIAIVLGAEGKGMRRLTMESCDMLLRIPINESMESLNVASAAAIVFYEARKV